MKRIEAFGRSGFVILHIRVDGVIYAYETNLLEDDAARGDLGEALTSERRRGGPATRGKQ
jgi:hypothetical protein